MPRTIASPSPVPPASRVARSSARTKRSKMRSRWSAGTPGPWSTTRITTMERLPGAASTRIGVPGGAWRSALLSRLSSTCPSRAQSAITSRPPSTSTVTLRPGEARSRRWTAAATASRTLTSTRLSCSAWPSILAMSSMSDTSLASRSVSPTMFCTSVRLDAGMAGSSSSPEVPVRIVARGVLSSCETLASSSARNRSVSSSACTCCSVRASRTATAAASACSRLRRSRSVLARRNCCASASARSCVRRRREPRPPTRPAALKNTRRLTTSVWSVIDSVCSGDTKNQSTNRKLVPAAMRAGPSPTATPRTATTAM